MHGHSLCGADGIISGTKCTIAHFSSCSVRKLGVQSGVKYEYDGGPGFKQCYELLNLSTKPALDRRNLLRWLFFNLCVGNNDSHAKNLSILATSDGLRLTPFYDMMCTRVYARLSPHFAFAIAGEAEPGKLTHEHLAQLARTLGIGVRYLQKLAVEIAQQVHGAVSIATNEVKPLLPYNERIMAERLEQRIKTISTSMGKRFAGDETDAADDDPVSSVQGTFPDQ